MNVLDKYRCEGQMSIFDLDIWSGKMSPEPSVQTKEKTSEWYLKKLRELRIKPPLYLDLRKANGTQAEPSWEMGGALLGEYTMRSFGESPNAVRESRLSQILVGERLQKYYLSARACQGILRRAENRGKELPPMLKEALERQSASKNEEESRGAVKESSSNTSGQEHCPPLTTNQCLNSWDVQSKHIQPETGTAEALYSGECRGGDGESYVLQKVVYRKKGHPQNAEQGQGWEQTETNDTLNAFDNGESRTPTIVLDNHPQDSRFKIKEDGVFPTMSARQGAEGAPNTLMVLENHPNDSRVKIREDGTVQTLSSRMGTGGGDVPLVMEQPITASKASYFMKQHDDGVAETLVATDYKDPQLVAYGLDRASFNQGKNAKYNFSIEEEKIGAQVASGPGAVFNSVVRRLTPLECERLQGYPDGWTDIGEWVDSKGKKHKDADSPRYKALGNSIALPFWEWMAARTVKYIDHKPTMASLFDGIGGFPLVFTRAGCKPMWASEIEEFPIAVTKIRFPEGGKE